MLLAFIAGWVLGSFSLYAYLVLTAEDSPHSECLDCRSDSCEDCSMLALTQEQRYGLAA